MKTVYLIESLEGLVLAVYSSRDKAVTALACQKRPAEWRITSIDLDLEIDED